MPEIELNGGMRKLASFIVMAALSVRVWAAEGKVDFTKDIKPILEQNCVKCHGEEKQKGKLRLDYKDAAVKGGKAGPALVAGNVEKSELFRRVTLPKSDDDFMPSEGEPLSKAQIDLIREWIKQGAVWPDTGAPKTAKAVEKGPVLPSDFKPGPNEAKAIAKLTEAGVDVRPIAVNVPWREANLRLQGTNATDATVALLKDVTSLVELNLANTKVTDAGLAHLKGLTYLQRLHLELTGVTDAGLAHLKPLTNLVYLNLYSTKVSDAGLENLKDMKYLRNLYTWQSKVSEEGAAKLKKTLPEVQISTGTELAELAKKIEERKAEEKRKEEEKKKQDEEKKKADEKKAAEKKEAEKKEVEKKEAEKKEAEKKETADKKEEKKEEKKDEKKEEKKQ